MRGILPWDDFNHLIIVILDLGRIWLNEIFWFSVTLSDDVRMDLVALENR